MALPSISSCCGCCTIRTGAIIISVLTLISSVLLIASIYSVDLEGEEYEDLRNVRIVLTVFSAIGLVIALLLLFGIIKRNPKLVLPWVILYGLGICINIISAIYVFIATIVAGAVGSAFGSLVGSVIGIFISMYLWLVVYTHYKELKDGSFEESGHIRPATSYQQP